MSSPRATSSARRPRDHVTGLATRGDFEHALAAALAARPPEDVALAICDVVGLKDVNAARGFVAGDAMLAAAAFERAADGAELVARLGGDEMVAVFVGPGAHDAADRTALAAGGVTPPLRAAAAAALPAEAAGRLIDRLYAAMRAS
ncbi:MAG: diguanylate cyclase domain-containing protein [Planctomycetota bacterium]